MTDHENASPKSDGVRAVIYGFLASIAVVVVPFVITIIADAPQTGNPEGLSAEPFRVYGFSSLFLLPATQGVVTGFFIGRGGDQSISIPGAALLLLSLDFMAGVWFLGEGLICLIMAAPLFFGLLVLAGYVGRYLSRIAVRAVHSSLIPLMAIAVVADTLSPPPEFSNAISDAVTIDAPPEAVWKYIVAYPENTSPPEYWLWRLGLPTPIQSTAVNPQVGAIRHCRFTDGIAFEEKITELTQNKLLTFIVTKQPDHPELNGHFYLDKGQLYLESNPDGSTTVIATSWYRIFAKQSWYFDWWAEDITRQVHFRVLGHIKRLAETDIGSGA